ncbi:MAG: AAA family ATPase, partial [Kiritimatiellaeota bacterium]|nr:AAA family ATPase [Kiritimatiellota bacterium]
MSLDQSRLENVHPSGGKVLARCPACAEQGGDKTGDHLFQSADGKFGCIQFQGAVGNDHRKRIFELVGVPDEKQTTPSAVPGQSSIVEEYDYTDAVGKVLYKVRRYIPKDFRPFRPDGKGGWILGVEGVERVLFRLPAVLEQAKREGDIFLAEGEKDANALVKIGLCATSAAFGAKSKWEQAYSEALRRAHVIIIAHKDDAGRERAPRVKAALQGIAASVRILEMPDRGGKPVNDAHDWITAGGTAEELAEIIRSADKPADVPDEFPAMTLADLQAYQPDPERDHIAGNGWLRRGAMTLFIGATGIGKSVAIEQVCISAAAGLPIFGSIAVARPRKVVLLQAENDEETMKRDALSIVAGIQADAATVTSNLTMRWVYALSGPRFVAYAAQLLERERPDLLALDNYQAFSGDDINSTELWQAWYRPLIKACIEYRAA